jgi:hypothetical protein
MDILEKLKEFMDKGVYVKDTFPEILEKHDATEIASGFADKLDTITDPFERLLVGIHMVDRINEIEAEMEMVSNYQMFSMGEGNRTLLWESSPTPMHNEELDMCQRHKEMVEVSLYVNTGRYEEAEEALERYMEKF